MTNTDQFPKDLTGESRFVCHVRGGCRFAQRFS